jgi:hypothetical protein
MLLLKKSPMKKLVYAFIGMLFISCTNYPETPQKVLQQYLEHMSAGNCDRAIDLCYGSAKEIVYGSIDGGCESYEASIESINCETRDTVCRCICSEKREIIGALDLHYTLILVDGKWKVYDLNKDQPTWDMIDNGKDWNDMGSFMEEY